MIELAGFIRAAIVAASSVTNNLTAYKSSYPVFTVRPAPVDAPTRYVMIEAPHGVTDMDLINSEIPWEYRDVCVYGPNDTPAHVVAVETTALAIRNLFHRQRTAISPTNWQVIDIRASGPVPAPVDDEKRVGRRVTLAIRLTPAA